MPDIKGVIDSIVFQNEENGYTIAKMDSGSQVITLVGILPYLTEGNQYRVTGEWVVHPKFGEQLKVDKVEEVLPTTASGIVIFPKVISLTLPPSVLLFILT